jgi:hypothetical protein
VVIVVAVVVAIIAIAAMVLSAAAAKKRREELAALARELGWTFDENETAPGPEYGCFDCFERGHSRQAYNTMSGSAEIGGREFGALAGDFTYKVTTSNGKTTTTATYRFSYLMFRPPFGDTPALTIRRENLLDKIAGAVGFDDINFESEEFSRKYFVKCTDKKFAYDVVSPAMMEFLMPGMPAGIVIRDGLACLADGSHRWDAGEFRTRVRWLERFFELWPEFLTEQLDQRARGGGAA